MEKFKESKKSICHNCSNFKESCSMVSKVCDTDSKMGLAYVSRCSLFNKEFKEYGYQGQSISVSSKADTRIEMMGGGFKEIE